MKKKLSSSLLALSMVFNTTPSFSSVTEVFAESAVEPAVMGDSNIDIVGEIYSSFASTFGTPVEMDLPTYVENDSSTGATYDGITYATIGVWDASGELVDDAATSFTIADSYTYGTVANSFSLTNFSDKLDDAFGFNYQGASVDLIAASWSIGSESLGDWFSDDVTFTGTSTVSGWFTAGNHSFAMGISSAYAGSAGWVVGSPSVVNFSVAQKDLNWSSTAPTTALSTAIGTSDVDSYFDSFMGYVSGDDDLIEWKVVDGTWGQEGSVTIGISAIDSSISVNYNMQGFDTSYSFAFEITHEASPESINWNTVLGSTSYNMDTTPSFALKTIADYGGTTASITWSIDNDAFSDVATISSNIVTFAGTGDFTLLATADRTVVTTGYTHDYTIAVTDNSNVQDTISWGTVSFELAGDQEIGATAALPTTVAYGTAGSDAALTWTSSNSAVASVNGYEVSFASAGSFTLTAEADFPTAGGPSVPFTYTTGTFTVVEKPMNVEDVVGALEEFGAETDSYVKLGSVSFTVDSGSGAIEFSTGADVPNFEMNMTGGSSADIIEFMTAISDGDIYIETADANSMDLTVNSADISFTEIEFASNIIVFGVSDGGAFSVGDGLPEMTLIFDSVDVNGGEEVAMGWFDASDELVDVTEMTQNGSNSYAFSSYTAKTRSVGSSGQIETTGAPLAGYGLAVMSVDEAENNATQITGTVGGTASIDGWDDFVGDANSTVTFSGAFSSAVITFTPTGVDDYANSTDIVSVSVAWAGTSESTTWSFANSELYDISYNTSIEITWDSAYSTSTTTIGNVVLDLSGVTDSGVTGKTLTFSLSSAGDDKGDEAEPGVTDPDDDYYYSGTTTTPSTNDYFDVSDANLGTTGNITSVALATPSVNVSLSNVSSTLSGYSSINSPFLTFRATGTSSAYITIPLKNLTPGTRIAVFESANGSTNWSEINTTKVAGASATMSANGIINLSETTYSSTMTLGFTARPGYYYSFSVVSLTSSGSGSGSGSSSGSSFSSAVYYNSGSVRVNGSYITELRNVLVGELVNLSKITTVNGQTVLGWYTDSAMTQEITNPSQFVVTSDVIANGIYAKTSGSTVVPDSYTDGSTNAGNGTTSDSNSTYVPSVVPSTVAKLLGKLF